MSPEGQFLPLEDGRYGSHTDALQIIQEIRYLRDENRALASLTYENIFLTNSDTENWYVSLILICTANTTILAYIKCFGIH